MQFLDGTVNPPVGVSFWWRRPSKRCRSHVLPTADTLLPQQHPFSLPSSVLEVLSQWHLLDIQKPVCQQWCGCQQQASAVLHGHQHFLWCHQHVQVPMVDMVEVSVTSLTPLLTTSIHWRQSRAPRWCTAVNTCPLPTSSAGCPHVLQVMLVQIWTMDFDSSLPTMTFKCLQKYHVQDQILSRNDPQPLWPEGSLMIPLGANPLSLHWSQQYRSVDSILWYSFFCWT